MSPLFTAAPEPALDAMFAAIEAGHYRIDAARTVLFLRARDGAALRRHATPQWRCEQSFRPFADALLQAGLRVGEASAGEHFAHVLLLPPRQRDEARALFARAVSHAGPDGRVLAAAANDAGARSLEDDLRQLAGPLECWSKQRCRVFWTAPGAAVDTDRLAAWAALDRLQPVAGGDYVSRPGLFSWDRIDRASALLAEALPTDLHGRIADLGGGWGYLSAELLRRCPAIDALDLYEAEARALPAAEHNLARANAGRATPAVIRLHWHDVTTGLPLRYDAIISNPPFHVGRADQPALGIAFIEAAAGALRADGTLWLVANRHLPYEATLQARFGRVRTVVDSDGFKVIEAREPRR